MSDIVLILVFIGGMIFTPIILYIHARFYDRYYEKNRKIGFDDVITMCLIGLIWYLYWPAIIVLNPFVKQS